MASEVWAIALILSFAGLMLGLMARDKYLESQMSEDRLRDKYLNASPEGPNQESVFNVGLKTALDGPVGSSPAARQVASGRKNVRVLNGFITGFNVIAAIGLALTVGRGLYVASDEWVDTSDALLGTLFGAVTYVIGWLLAWALISVMKNILGAVTESLALNAERADSDHEPVKAAA